MLHLDPSSPLDAALHCVPLTWGVGGSFITLLVAALRGRRD